MLEYFACRTVGDRRILQSADGARIEVDNASGVGNLYLDTNKFAENVPITVKVENSLGMTNVKKSDNSKI